MNIRRFKHWGWGYEDQQPTPQALRATAGAVAEHLGLALGEIESPTPLADVELAPPRVPVLEARRWDSPVTPARR